MTKNLLSIKRKKRKPRALKSFDVKYMGLEPTWNVNQTPTNSDISRAYTWYNYFNSHKDSIKLLFDNYPRDKREIKSLRKLEDWKISSVLGAQARMVSMGCKLPKESKNWFDDKIDECLNFAKLRNKIVKKEKKKETPRISIQERIKEQISTYIAEIEEEIDKFDCGHTDFEIYNWLKIKNVKQAQANAIANYYKPLLAELQELQEDNCEQLREAYQTYSKESIERFTAFINGIIIDSTQWAVNQSTVRKTRQKKPTSIVKQISKLKYLKDYTDLKLVSVNPAEIIGSNEVWTFNVKHRKLTRYITLTHDGFNIQGTTLKGIDVDRSETKTIRKPNDVLPRVLSGGKRILNKILHEVNSKGYEPNGRINGDTILLRVIK